MSGKSSVSATTCVCSDSKLSIAANIIGIITFAYVVGAGIVLYLQRGADLVRNSIKEIKENVEAEVGFVLEVMNLSGQMGHGWGESNIEGVSDHEPEMGSLEEETNNSIAVVRTLLQQVDRDPFLHSFRNPYPTLFHRLSMTSQYIFGQKKKMVERQKLIALVRHEFEDARQKMVRL